MNKLSNRNDPFGTQLLAGKNVHFIMTVKMC